LLLRPRIQAILLPTIAYRCVNALSFKLTTSPIGSLDASLSKIT
jgi:hypothetical protein